MFETKPSVVTAVTLPPSCCVLYNNSANKALTKPVIQDPMIGLAKKFPLRVVICSTLDEYWRLLDIPQTIFPYNMLPRSL